MHELGLARELFQKILKTAEEKKLKKITEITIVIGVAAGIEKGFLSHSFNDHIFPGTLAEGAALVYKDEPVEVFCNDCKKSLCSEKEFSLNCPYCKSYNIEIKKGNDYWLESVLGE